ncbi:MAG: glycosyltransferase, partial [Flavobacterium sp.]|nr:glycosyltransferase [Flavobacterium sp.]
VLFIKGVIGTEQKNWQENQITFYNYMNSEQLEIAFNESDKIVCRSGYTTVMDLAHLGKKAFFIPTPGQYEQEYLARKYQRENLAPYCRQDKFVIEKLDKIEMYRGFQNFSKPVIWNDLFRLF